MRKILLTLASLAIAASAFAQGYVSFNNSPTQLIRTNSTAFGGTTGPTANSPEGFYYGLFIAPMLTLDNDLTNPVWTFTGNYATNTANLGRLSGGPGTGVVVDGWPGGTSSAYMVAGWSSNLGHDWSTILPQLQSSAWDSPNAFFGQSAIGWGIAGSGPLGKPVLALFGAVHPAIQGFDLLQVPEPGTITLVGLGAALLLSLHRRRK